MNFYMIMPVRLVTAISECKLFCQVLSNHWLHLQHSCYHMIMMQYEIQFCHECHSNNTAITWHYAQHLVHIIVNSDRWAASEVESRCAWIDECPPTLLRVTFVASWVETARVWSPTLLLLWSASSLCFLVIWGSSSSSGFLSSFVVESDKSEEHLAGRWLT